MIVLMMLRSSNGDKQIQGSESFADFFREEES